MAKKKSDEGLLGENTERTVSFETKIEEAKRYLDTLIKPEITLSQSVEAYKKGIAELEIAQKLLESAKLEYQEILTKE